MNKNNPIKKIFITLQHKEDVYISSYIIFYFLTNAVKSLLNTALQGSQFFLLINLCINVSRMLLLFITIRFVLKRAFVYFFCAECFAVIIYLLSYLQGNAENSILLDNAATAILICIPMSAYVYSIKDKQVFYDIFLKFSYIMSACLILSVFFPQEKTYNMFFSYALLPVTLFHINEWFSKYKKIHLLIFSFEILMIVLRGSRGALLCIGVFFIIKFAYSKISIFKKVAVISSGVFIIINFVINFNKIGELILNYLESIGYHSRTVFLFFSGNITYDSGRSDITNHYLTLIEQNPILGWGVCGGWINNGSYPHNIFIELIASFGIFAGTFFIVIIGLLCVKTLLQQDSVCRDLTFIYFSYSISLLLSGTFLTSYAFWIFIGFAMSPYNFKTNILVEYVIVSYRQVNAKG